MKLFDKWETKDIVVTDIALRDYINLNPIIVPRTQGRFAKYRFWKSKQHIVERFMNKIMVPGHRGKKHKISSGVFAGKGNTVYKIMKETLELIETRTKKNPVEVLVKAIENAAPREEITTIEYGGARYPQAVDCSPQRRIDIALRQMTQGAYAKSFDSKKKISECLADEIIAACNLDQKSTALSKKLELERQSDSSR